MNFELEPKYKAIQNAALDLTRQIEPMAAEADGLSVVHEGVLEALRESGLCRLMVRA